MHCYNPDMEILNTHSKSKSPRGGGTEFPTPKSRRTPSFSSTLLDSIYRSIDESHSPNQRSKPRNSTGNGFEILREEMENVRKIIAAEKHGNPSGLSNSGSSSSESSYGGSAMFSSSEAESNFGEKIQKSMMKSFKPIRTDRDFTTGFEIPSQLDENNFRSPSKTEGRFRRTKSRALKMYGDLKKAKHPISPGGRIASFINSLFSGSSTSLKKSAKPSSDSNDMFYGRKSRSVQESMSRLSTATPPPPSSRSGGGSTRRCVRFCPVSVIVDEDGHESIEHDDPSLTPIPNFARNAQIGSFSKNREVKKNRGATDRTRTADQVEAAARNYLMRGFHQKQGSTIMSELEWRARRVQGDFHGDEEGEEEEEDDAQSCASSDLFELDNNVVGIGRYRQELPVYETTSLKKNHAIAKAFVF